MKLNIMILLFGLNLLINQNLFSQTNLSTELNTGGSAIYVTCGFGNNWDNLSDAFDDSKYSSSTYLRTDRNFHSYGAGHFFDGSIGVNLNAVYSLELNVRSFSGKIIESKRYQSYPNKLYGSKYEFESSALMFTPRLVIELPKFISRITPFVKLGVVLAYPEIITRCKETTSTDKLELDIREDGRTCWGYNLDIGARFEVYNKLEILTSVEITGLNFKPAKSTYTKATLNGQNYSHFLTNPEYDYADSREGNDQNTLIQPSYSFSSIGLHLGLQYHF
ncbi:MAG: hypothetical protein HY965_04180 [Ignavibacteriales bacterium]|nr:hypothetical protein [Ignavibacteriales bacterium]